jgi:hypothetical protein
MIYINAEHTRAQVPVSAQAAQLYCFSSLLLLCLAVKKGSSKAALLYCVSLQAALLYCFSSLLLLCLSY